MFSLVNQTLFFMACQQHDCYYKTNIQLLFVVKPFHLHHSWTITLFYHFVRCTMLVLGLTASVGHGIDSTRLWKNLSETLVHVDTIVSQSCCLFFSCTSVMLRSHLIKSQCCPFGLGSGDCGFWRTVNSWSCSRDQFEIIWASLHGMLSCWKKLSKDVYTVIRNGWTCTQYWTLQPSHKPHPATAIQKHWGRLWCWSNAHLGPKNIPHKLQDHHQQPEPLIQGKMNPSFRVAYNIITLNDCISNFLLSLCRLTVALHALKKKVRTFQQLRQETGAVGFSEVTHVWKVSTDVTLPSEDLVAKWAPVIFVHLAV